MTSRKEIELPESRVRKEAKEKRKQKRFTELGEQRAEKKLMAPPTRNWVPWLFIPVGLLGVLWMVVYNLAGNVIGFMSALGNWNMLIGIGLIMVSFGLMTLWK